MPCGFSKRKTGTRPTKRPEFRPSLKANHLQNKELQLLKAELFAELRTPLSLRDKRGV